MIVTLVLLLIVDHVSRAAEGMYALEVTKRGMCEGKKSKISWTQAPLAGSRGDPIGRHQV